MLGSYFKEGIRTGFLCIFVRYLRCYGSSLLILSPSSLRDFIVLVLNIEVFQIKSS